MGSRTPASKPKLKILALEPYLALSHAVFLEGYRKYSRHQVEIWSLPAKNWKWRMRGGALHFADRAARESGHCPHVVLASDYLNLSDWRALAPPGWRDAPCVVYFHENQVTYPLGSRAPVDFHYGWINLGTALAADRVLFNSRYHMEVFLREVSRGLGRMADPVPEDLPARIRAKSRVFPVGLDFDLHRRVLARESRVGSSVPVIAWNHRWEYDKDPELLLDTLLYLKQSRIPFGLILCGQAFRDIPESLQRISSELKEEIIQMGFLPERERYLEVLARADIVLSTARQEFFGVSVVEAMFLGCLPVLPRALSYPELLPPELHAPFLYDAPEALPAFLASILEGPPNHLRPAVQRAAARFDWRHLAGELDGIIEGTPRRD